MDLCAMTEAELWREILKIDVEENPQEKENCPTDESILNQYVLVESPDHESEIVMHIHTCTPCFYKSILLFLQNKTKL